MTRLRAHDATLIYLMVAILQDCSAVTCECITLTPLVLNKRNGAKRQIPCWCRTLHLGLVEFTSSRPLSTLTTK
jgi:hypothetical protein